jgi:hypothetical protein
MKAFPNNRSEGMDLRDYFAIEAMPILYQHWNETYFDSRHPDFYQRLEEAKDITESMIDLIALWSYALADAMMKERENNAKPE